MNKTSTSTRFCKFFFVFLIYFNSGFQIAWGQGFFTTTDHAYDVWDTRFEILSDGYCVKASYKHPTIEGVSFFGRLCLDKEGNEISWDSTMRVSGTDGPGYYWLTDDDILEVGRDSSGPNWKIQKYRLNSNLIWSQIITPYLYEQQIFNVGQNDQGKIFILGHESDIDPWAGANNLFLHKLDVDGSFEWTFRSPMPDSSGGFSSWVDLTPDGGLIYQVVVYLHNPEKTLSTLNKISASGQLLWSDSISYNASIYENDQGEVYTLGIKYEPAPLLKRVIFEKRNIFGQLIWSKTIGTNYQFPAYPIESENGDLLINGFTINDAGFPIQNFFNRYDSSGNLIWERHYSFLSGAWGSICGMGTPDNGFLVVGQRQSYPFPFLYVLKMDANGNVYPGQISGQLSIDENLSCLIDTSEQTPANWKVRLNSSNYTLFATTDNSGHYEIADIPGDDYLLSAVFPSNLWESCPDDIPVSIQDTGAVTISQDLPIQVITDCPFMTLDISTFGLRRCFPSTYNVHYCNSGTIAADSAYITIQLDPLLDLNSASIPFTQSGDTLYFSLGSMASLECGDFSFNVTVNCDSAQLGQTLCVSAAIFPDTICNPPSNWSGALLRGIGTCLGDSVHFQIENIGTAPSSAGLNSYVVDEHVIMFQQTLPIMTPQETFDITLPADGSTWRLISQQEPNAPGLEMPSIGVEGCGAGGPPSWGFLLQFANRDGSPFTDQDCHQVVGSYDPNDKMAFPIGVNEEHFIEKNQPIDYQIRFQNTGTDTAFTVVVKDTLSPWLDPATIRPGASSHPYTWTLSGAGILTFSFEHILLPDSNINEVASHGFIQFSINQQKDLSEGTLLENRAGIYFDFNEAVMTNTVFHTIQHDFLPVTDIDEIHNGLPLLQIWPNPAAQETTIFTDQPFNAGEHLVLRNSLGQVLRDIQVNDQSVKLQRKGLPAGLYFVELRNEQSILQVGKMIWE